MEEIDERLQQTEVRARKNFLIRQLNNMGVYQSRDDRNIESLSLYSLEWMHVEEKNKAAKAFGEEGQ